MTILGIVNAALCVANLAMACVPRNRNRFVNIIAALFSGSVAVLNWIVN